MDIRLAPRNSIIFVYDPTHPVVVPDIGAGSVWATDSCVAVGTLAEMDGETTIRLASDFVDPPGEIVFQGAIEAPGGVVGVHSSETEGLLSIRVSRRAAITIWTNDPREPDLILVRAR